MPHVHLMPRLIQLDLRLRDILDRADPLTIYGGGAVPAVAETSAGGCRAAMSALAARGRQGKSFVLGFLTSGVVVLTAIAAQPARPITQVSAPAAPIIVADSRVGTFAAPSLAPRMTVARITVLADEEVPAASPTPAFNRAVVPVIAAMIAPAQPLAKQRPDDATSRVEAPAAGRQAAKPLTRAKPPAPAKSAKSEVAKAEYKPVMVRTVRPSPEMVRALSGAVGAAQASPAPIRLSAPRAAPPWGNDWMRSTLGMGQHQSGP